MDKEEDNINKVVDKLEDFNASQFIKKIAAKKTALMNELFSLDDTLSNFLRLATGIDIPYEQLDNVLAVYSRKQNNNGNSRLTTGQLPNQKHGLLNKKKISKEKAKNLIPGLLMKYAPDSLSSVRSIELFLNKEGYEIGYKSLQAALTELKKSSVLENHRNKGWIIVHDTQSY